MNLASWGALPWERSASRVDRIEPVQRGSASGLLRPLRGDELRPLTRPDPSGLYAGDVAHFERLVGFRGAGEQEGPLVVTGGQAPFQEPTGTVRSSIGQTPAERVVLGLAHLRTLHGL
jgi:hypothetical protein